MKKLWTLLLFVAVYRIPFALFLQRVGMANIEKRTLVEGKIITKKYDKLQQEENYIFLIVLLYILPAYCILLKIRDLKSLGLRIYP